jgi:site-specific DNA-methyltransferase (adenine-specific)
LPKAKPKAKPSTDNVLYYGDNLDVLRRHVADESVDLVYLDPPFNSQADYNVLFAEHSGKKAAAQIQAFEDTWTWDTDAARAYEDVVERGGAVSQAMQACRQLLGESDMLAYLAMMTPRLVELHRVLKDAGSLYLHCDPTASHYLKIILDAMFGPSNFRNEIIWKRAPAKGHNSIRFSRGHDIILYYAKSPAAPFNVLYAKHRDEYVESHYSNVEEGTGRRYQLTSLINPNADRPNLKYEFPLGSGTVKVWRWTKDRMTKAYEDGLVVVPKGGGVARYKRYLDEQEGTPMTDVW